MDYANVLYLSCLVQPLEGFLGSNESNSFDRERIPFHWHTWNRTRVEFMGRKKVYDDLLEICGY
jgi:hypothetical protein